METHENNYKVPHSSRLTVFRLHTIETRRFNRPLLIDRRFQLMSAICGTMLYAEQINPLRYILNLDPHWQLCACATRFVQVTIGEEKEAVSRKERQWTDNAHMHAAFQSRISGGLYMSFSLISQPQS